MQRIAFLDGASLQHGRLIPAAIFSTSKVFVTTI
jgi:hypothetical protein